MASPGEFDWLDPKKPLASAAPAAPSAPQPPKVEPRASEFDWLDPGKPAVTGGGWEAPTAPAKGPWQYRPLTEVLGGFTASSLFDEAVRKFLPASFQRDRGESWVGRFAMELARGGPEVLDFIQSPTGAALFAAHLIPYTRPLAMLADIGMGGLGLAQAVPELKQAYSDGKPESWAAAVKGLMFSTGMLKGGTKGLVASTMKFRADPFEVREATQAAVRNRPAGMPDILKVAQKHVKTLPGDQLAPWAQSLLGNKQLEMIPPEAIPEWAVKPLSEIETAQKKAFENYQFLKDKVVKRAKEEKRPISYPEQRELRKASQPSRLLRDLAKATLPEKIRYTNELKAAQAPTFSKKAIDWLYGSAFLREPAKIIGIPKTKFMQVSVDAVGDWQKTILKRHLDVTRMLYDMKRDIPESDLEVTKMGYVLQGDATPDEVGLSPAARAAIPILREFVKTQDDLQYGLYGKDLPLQDAETYLTQIWRFADEGSNSRSRSPRALIRDPFHNKRVISSYKTGIEEYGLVPRYNNVLDLIRIRADFATRAMANRRFAGWLRDMGAVITEDEYHKIRPARRLLHEGEAQSTATGIQYGTNPPELSVNDWRQAEDATALYRAAYTDKPADKGMMMKPVYVHPDYYDAVTAIFGKGGYKSPAWAALDTIRALGKQTALSFSMFHHWALSEQAHAIYATRKPLGALGKTFFFNPEWYRGLAPGVFEKVSRGEGKPPAIRFPEELVYDFIDHTGMLRSEDSGSMVIKRLRSMETSNNAIARKIGKAIKPAASVLERWDAALWDYFHTGSMLNSYELIVSQELPKLGPNATPAQIRGLKTAAAQHVNNAYGAVSFEQMLLSPKLRQSLNWIMLAPAWTFSNIRVMTTGYESAAGTKLTNQYVQGAVASWFLTTQMMNFALSGWFTRNDPDGPKPRLTYDNPGLPFVVNGKRLKGLTENTFNIYAGKNPDGSERYIVFGKGPIREPISWVTSPFETFFGKTSLPIRGVATQATKHSVGSGYEEIDPRGSEGEQRAQRIAAGLESVGLPFVLTDTAKKGLHALYPEAIQAPRASSQFLSLPTRKGTSFMRTLQAFREAIESGEDASDVLMVGAINGVDPERIKATYKQDLRKRQRRAAQ